MKKSARPHIHISVRDQRLILRKGRTVIRRFPISTSSYGLGSKEGSMKTPLGRFRIGEKIGDEMPMGTVFKNRKPVRVTKKARMTDDLVMSRILWLEGLERANRNTHDRFIYIHGTNHEDRIGEPASHGCIRMTNADVIELFGLVPRLTPVVIRNEKPRPMRRKKIEKSIASH